MHREPRRSDEAGGGGGKSPEFPPPSVSAVESPVRTGQSRSRPSDNSLSPDEPQARIARPEHEQRGEGAELLPDEQAGFDAETSAPSTGRSAAHLVAAVVTVAATVGAIALCVVVAIDRSVGHGVEALSGALFLIFALPTLTGAASTTITIPGLGEFVLGELTGGSSKAWALRGMRFAFAVSMAIIGGLLIAHSVGTTSSNLLVRGFALALVPICVAFAFMRWVLRTELAAASEAAEEAPQSYTINIEVPRPSKKLQDALLAQIARHPAAHALLSLAVAAFLILTAVSPSLASTVGHVVSYPWHVIDKFFDQLIDWVSRLF